MKGMLDRFEGSKAVVLIEEQNREWIVEKSQLPEKSEIGDWFTLEVTEGELSGISIDRQLTEEKEHPIDDLMESIRSKNKGSKFKRK